MQIFVFLWNPGALPDLIKAVTRRLKIPALLLMTLSVIFSNECRSGAQSAAPLSFMAAGLLTILNRPESLLPADFLKARKPAHWRSVRLPGECSAFEPCSFRLDKYHSAQCQPAGRCHFRGSEEGGQTLLLTGEAHIKISSAMAEYHLFPAADPLPEQDSEPSSQEQELPIRYQDRSGELFPVTSQAVLPGVVLDDDLDDTGLKIRLLVEHSRQVQGMMQQLRSQNIEPDGFIYNLKDGRLSHTLMNDIAEWLQETDVFHQGLPEQLQFSDFIEGVSDEPDEKGVPENLPYMFRWKYSRRGGPEPEFLVYDGKRWKPLDLSEEGRDSTERDESNGWALFREYMHGYLFDLLYPDDVAIPPPIRLSRVKGMSPEAPQRNKRQKNDLKDSPKDITSPDPEQKPVSSPVQTNQAGRITSKTTVTPPSVAQLLSGSGAFYQQRQMKYQDEVVANITIRLNTSSPVPVTKYALESREKGYALHCSLCYELLGGESSSKENVVYQTSSGNRLCQDCYKELDKAENAEDWARLISQRKDPLVAPTSKCPLCDCDNPSYSGHFKNCKEGIFIDKAASREAIVSIDNRWDNFCVCEKSFSDFRDTEKPGEVVGLKYHLQNDCSAYRIRCAYCCKPAVLKDYDKHLNSCAAYLDSPIWCLKCCHRVAVKDFEKHSRQCDFCKKSFPCLESGAHDKTCVRPCLYAWYGCTFKGTKAGLELHSRTAVISHLELVAKKDIARGSDASTTNFQMELDSITRRIDKLEEALAHSVWERAMDGIIRRIDKLEEDLTSRCNECSQKVASLEEELVGIQATIKEAQETLKDISKEHKFLETTSHEGTFIWKIPELTRRISDAVGGRIISLSSFPFYSSKFGYKMRLRVYLNGDGEGSGTHFSYFLQLMKGEYDGLLPWPFRQKVHLCLLAQVSGVPHKSYSFEPSAESISFQKPTSEMNRASGFARFCRLSVLKNANYVVADCLYLKVRIDITGIEHID